MGKLDKKIRKLSKEFQVPESYHEKVDEILETIREDDMPVPRSRVSLRAAGIAAAVAAADGTAARGVDIRKVRNLLVEQDVPLPRHPGVDPSYTECCEAHEYGLFTDMAKEAKTNPEYFKNFRQW